MPNPWDNDPLVDPFEDALKAEGVKGKVADIARSIYQQESSSGKNTKTSNAGAVGGMQIIPATFKSVADKDWDINDPTQNARAGIRYVKQLFEQAGGDPALTAAGYYGGPGGLEKARRGVAVSDPRNPKAPTTLEYGQQVAARLSKDKGIVQKAVEAVIPSANAATGNPWDNDPIVEAEAPKATPKPKEEPGIGARVLRAVGGALGPGQIIADAVTGGRFSRDEAAGLLRGAGSIGATLVRPFESAEENAQRRQAMDAGLSDIGADTGSLAYGGGKLAGEVAGTSGAGGVVAAPLRAVAPVVARAAPSAGNVLGRLASASTSAGLSVGPGGGVAANTLARIGGGALSGGASAGLVNPGDVGLGAGIGAALPPALNVASRFGGGLVGAARGVRDMATQAGQERIAGNILRASATNPEAAAANLARAQPLVPGSNPTIGQAAVDPGLAQLERTLINNPQTAPALQTRFAEQRAARARAIDDVAATGPDSGSYYDDIAEGRRIFANEDYARARDAGIDPEMAASMEREVASLMERPSIQSAVQDARRLAAETGETIDDLGSVQGLDWLKKALDNQISRARNPGSAIGAADLRALQQTSRDLNSVIEQLAPAYREANQNYAAMSRQINSMDVARDLERRYTPAAAEFGQSAEEQGAAYMRALRNAQNSVRGATGRDMALGDAMSTADIYQLENVARDLSRQQYAQRAGRAVGSPTAQNLLSQNLIAEVMRGAGLPLTAAADSTLLNTLLRPVQFAGRLAEPRVLNRLAEYAVNPNEAAAALRALPPQEANALANYLNNLQLPARAAPVLTSD